MGFFDFSDRNGPNRLRSVAAGVASTDAVNKAQMEAASVPMAGDVDGETGDNAIGAGKVTLPKLATLSSSSLIGNPGRTPATPSAIGREAAAHLLGLEIPLAGAAIGDADEVLTVAGGCSYAVPPSTLTANRAATLNVSGTAEDVPLDGEIITISRRGVEAFSLTVKNDLGATLFTFPAGMRLTADFRYDAGTSHFAFKDCRKLFGLPNQPVPGLKLWLRADLGIIQSGGTLSDWEDQSGYGNDATVSSGGPTIVAAAINSQKAVLFDASNVDALTGAFSPVGTDSPRTIVVVFKKATDADIACCFGIRLSDDSHSYFASGQGGQTYVYGEHFVTDGTLPGPLADPTDPKYIVFTEDGSNTVGSVQAAFNGAPLAPTTAAPASESGSPGYYIGARASLGNMQPWDGHIAEIMVWETVLGAPDYALLVAYLAARYGI